MADLRMGTSILKEHVDREAAKREHAERSRKDQKAMAEAAANKVNLTIRRKNEANICVGKIGLFRRSQGKDIA